jgi:putative membrane protein
VNPIIKLAITGASLWAAVWLVPGLDFSGTFWMFLGVTVIVVLANAVVKPILKVLSIPFIIFTFGLFILVVNALVLQLALWLSGSVFDLGISSTGFFWATFLGALVISVVSMILEAVFD